MKKYNEYKGLNLPQIDKDILHFWHGNRVFEQSIENRRDANPFVFYEGPPSANGLPGIHHVMSRTIKDLFCRYKSLKGYKVERKGGWDTHGLPVELGVEKALKITKEDIGVKISVAEYNEKCRESVLAYKADWDRLTKIMGYWVDLDNPYITFDKKYIESIWWILKQLYDKKLLYKGYTIQPFSPAAGTGLSSHELNLPGCYKPIKDTSVTAQFKVVRSKVEGASGQPELVEGSAMVRSRVLGTHHDPDFLFSAENEEVYFLAWTTTPWTLPSNTALAVGEKITYVKVVTFNPYTYLPVSVIMAKDLLSKYFKPENGLLPLEGYEKGQKEIPYKVMGEYAGKDLAGIRYEQLMPYVQPIDGDAFRVIIGDFVSTEDGTGIVHVAPSFGSDDMRVAKQQGIGSLTLVDRRGHFVPAVTDFADLPVKNYNDVPEKEWDSKENTDVKIAIKLKGENKAFKVEKYEHNYPHCWRTDKPVIYYPLDSWFIKTTAVKDRMVALNNTINWKPASTGTGRFGNWLENLVDWNLSRSRYWGTPLPIWRNRLANEEETDRDLIIGSFKEIIDNEGFVLGKEYDDFFDKIKNGDTEIIERIIRYNDDQKKLRNDNFEVVHLETIKRGQFDKDNLLRILPIDFLELYLPKVKEDDLLNLDPHKPFVDNIVFLRTRNAWLGGNHLFQREADLIDVWFDSGAMPYAQWHYPFENKEQFKENFPADFIAEGMDQTRGWFFTLHAIAVLLFDSVAYKNVVSNGLLLDKNGNKMSKRLGNTVDPFETLERYGADATRWYIISNSQPWDNLKFDVAGIQEVQRKFFGTLYNTYAFFALYANIDGFNYQDAEVPLADRPEIDRWIISLLNTLIKEVESYYEDYEPTKAARAIQDFVDAHLSNWYVRLCRRRFWKGEFNADKIAAYQTLYRCLEVLSQLASPIAPFFSEFLFRNLNNVTQKQKAISVHLTDFPKADETVIDKALEERMDVAQRICSLSLSIRKKNNIRVRQPLQRILVPTYNLNNPRLGEDLKKVEDLIKQEINVKEIEQLTDAVKGAAILHKDIKPNLPVIAKKYKEKMAQLIPRIQAFDQRQINELEVKQNWEFEDLGVILDINDFLITTVDIPGWKTATDGQYTVALDVTITDDLRSEGNARELVNAIQNLRKEMDFNVTDRISVQVQKQKEINSAVIHYKDYICTEVLAENLLLVDSVTNGNLLDVNGISLQVAIHKN